MLIKDRKLSPHFWLSEMIVTSHRGVDNTPNEAQIQNLVKTCDPMLEKVRAVCGAKPVYVTSGFRSIALNTLVGGTVRRDKNGNPIYSAHVAGMAADFSIPAFGTPRDVCKAIEGAIEDFPEVDQLIYEISGNTEWVHLAWDPNPRRDHNRIITGRNGVWSVDIN